MIEIILFDLGGVLVEVKGVQSVNEWSNKKFNVEEIWDKWINSPTARSFETGRLSPERFADKIIGEMKLSVGKTEFIRSFTQWPRGLFPGVEDLIKSLKNHFTLACLSNSNELHWPRLMNEMGLDTMFDHYFASHLTGRIKPDPDSFEYVLECLDCEAKSVLFFDDNDLNVQSARKIGMAAYKVKGPADINAFLAHERLIPVQNGNKDVVA